jgi:pyruvate/2-oxoglutarate dehydrogenase complex dihydrolipoamide acyltransferase (E2) component
MRHKIKLPKLSDTSDDVLVSGWIATVGDDLLAGDPLLSAETDKVDVEVPTPVAGRLVERLVAEDDEIGVGTPIAVIESS